ncbi:hypothetical protein GCM10010919_00230 [Alishewanella longhuensis]|uniref:PH domain-containing protein n=1 Tax=Alishewanella longhuensis TaxID=1091037 RepID=A0ABQ3KT92_9ALTE|nr:hypothetical protein [Alishewanella longhuensis]GHG58475.1 hypothetical protein GCM10010919_00230 [Alishewanella longhuensis]
MLWSIVKDSIPRQFLLVAAIALAFWLAGWLSMAFFVLLFALELVLFRSATLNSIEYVYSKDIFKLLHIEGKKLRVGMDSGTIKDITQIELWQQDQYGYLDFSLNAYSVVRYKFPVAQYTALVEWLSRNLPATALKTAFKG